MYSFKSGEYKYFEYDKQFVSKVKSTEVYPRKETEFEFSAGFRATMVDIKNSFGTNDNYIHADGGFYALPVSIYASAGKYFSRRHFVGLNGEIPVFSQADFFSGGLRYAYQYDAHKRNVAFYLPVELHYFQGKANSNFKVIEKVYDAQSGISYSLYKENVILDYTLRAFSFSLGQGFSFIMKNKHSLALELSLVRFFPLEPKYTKPENDPPKTTATGNGFRFSLIYNI